jgi:hypothetical protein
MRAKLKRWKMRNWEGEKVWKDGRGKDGRWEVGMMRRCVKNGRGRDRW